MNNYILIIILLLLIIFNLNFKEGLNEHEFNIDDINKQDKILFNKNITQYIKDNKIKIKYPDPSHKSNFLEQITKLINEALKRLKHLDSTNGKAQSTLRNIKKNTKISTSRKNHITKFGLNSNSNS